VVIMPNLHTGLWR